MTKFICIALVALLFTLTCKSQLAASAEKETDNGHIVLKAINQITSRWPKSREDGRMYGPNKVVNYFQIYHTKEYAGMLIIKPYSLFSVQLKGRSSEAYIDFLKKHDFLLRDSEGQVVPTEAYYAGGHLTFTQEGYGKEIYKQLRDHPNMQSFQSNKANLGVHLKGWDSMMEDGLVVHPQKYLVGDIQEDVIDQVFTFEIRQKDNQELIYTKKCMTLFRLPQKSMVLFQILVLAKGWEETYGYYPEYYHHLDAGLKWCNRNFERDTGKKLMDADHLTFVLRYEVDEDSDAYKEGSVAYGGHLRPTINRIKKRLGHTGYHKEIYQLIRSPIWLAKGKLFGWRWAKKTNINADIGQERSRLNYYGNDGKYSHELGHNLGLLHRQGGLMSMPISHYYYCQESIRRLTPIFTWTKASRGLLRKSTHDTYIGDFDNVIPIRGGYHKIYNNSATVNKQTKEASIYIRRAHGNIEISDLGAMLFYFEPEKDGLYGLEASFKTSYEKFKSANTGAVHVAVYLTLEDPEKITTDDKTISLNNASIRHPSKPIKEIISPITNSTPTIKINKIAYQGGLSYPIFMRAFSENMPQEEIRLFLDKLVLKKQVK